MPELDSKALDMKRSDIHIELKPDGLKVAAGCWCQWQGAFCRQT